MPPLPPRGRRPSRTHAIAIAALALAGCLDAHEIESSADPVHGDQIVVTVRDAETGEQVPARVVLMRAGVPVRIGYLDMWGERQSRGYCQLAPGAIGTWDGIALASGHARIPFGRAVCGGRAEIPYGGYEAWILRGIEWEPEVTQLDLRFGAGPVELEVHLSRAFRAEGALSADLHVHADNSNDSLVPARVRVITQAAAGIQVVGLTEHNFHADLGTAIDELGMADRIASIAGVEVTPDDFHFGVLPALVDCARPRCGALGDDELAELDVEDVLDRLRALPHAPFVTVNHPRFATGSLFTSRGWKSGTWPPPFPLDFDGMEVLSTLTAFNEPDDDRLDVTVADFYALIEHGVFVTALGNSDTHHLNWVLDGSTRNYVYVSPPTVAPFDELAFIAALRGRRVVATTGPWLDIRANGVGPGGTTSPGVDGTVTVDIRLQQASFVHTDLVRVLVSGEVYATLDVPPGARDASWRVVVPARGGTWIGVDASGATPLPALVTGTYQQDAGRAGVLPFALINPIVVRDSLGAGATP